MLAASSRRPATARVTRPGGAAGGAAPAPPGAAPLAEPAGGFGGDAELLADFPEALAAAIQQPEAGLDGVARPAVEGAEQLVEQLAVHARHHLVLGAGLVGADEVHEGGVTLVAHVAVERDRRGQAVELGVLGVELLTVTSVLAQCGSEHGRAVAREADEA